jgi:hypothetical protein
MIAYPRVAWETFDAEVLECGINRYRLIFGDKYAGRFYRIENAVAYYYAEFACFGETEKGGGE